MDSKVDYSDAELCRENQAAVTEVTRGEPMNCMLKLRVI